jgi:hypothetical protein
MDRRVGPAPGRAWTAPQDNVPRCRIPILARRQPLARSAVSAPLPGNHADESPVGGLTLADPEFPGVSFRMSEQYLATWRRCGSPDPSPDSILRELRDRFRESLKEYGSRKATLPACLQNALDTYVTELQSGKAQLAFSWQPYTETPTQSWEKLVRLPISAGQAKPPGGIDIYGRPTSTAWIEPGQECFRIGAATIFHEFVHMASLRYSTCFSPDMLQNVNPQQPPIRIEQTETVTVYMPPRQLCNESWTEDATRAVFPEACRVYPVDPKCPMDKICKCQAGCPTTQCATSPAN